MRMLVLGGGLAVSFGIKDFKHFVDQLVDPVLRDRPVFID